MNFMSKTFIFSVISLSFFGALQANEYCQCLKVTTYQKLGDKIQYTAQCYVDGKQTDMIESATLNSVKEAQDKTDKIAKTYNINVNDCVEYPDGTMILLPQKKKD